MNSPHLRYTFHNPVNVTYIIRPHRSMSIDKAYCYRRSNVVCRSVCLSVCLSVCQSETTVSPAKTAERIEMPFRVCTQVGSRNHVSLLDVGVQLPTREWGSFKGKRARSRSCQDMSGGRYTQSDSAGGSTGTVRMLIGVY